MKDNQKVDIIEHLDDAGNVVDYRLVTHPTTETTSNEPIDDSHTHLISVLPNREELLERLEEARLRYWEINKMAIIGDFSVDLDEEQEQEQEQEEDEEGEDEEQEQEDEEDASSEDEFGRSRGYLFGGLENKHRSKRRGVGFTPWEQPSSVSEADNVKQPLKSAIKSSTKQEQEDSLGGENSRNTTTMSTHVVERAALKVDKLNGDEDDDENVDLSRLKEEINREYYTLRDRMIKTHGGYRQHMYKEEEETDLAGDQGLDPNQEPERSGNKRKPSLFKAARLGKS